MDSGHSQGCGLVTALEVSGGYAFFFQAANEFLTEAIGRKAGLELYVRPQSRGCDGHVKWPAAQRRGVVVQAARGHRNEVHEAFTAHMNSHVSIVSVI